MLTRIVALFTAIFAIAGLVPINTFADCSIDSSGLAETRRTLTCSGEFDWGHYHRYNKYQINWSDYSSQRTELSSSGECVYLSQVNCEPAFYQPYYGSTSTVASFHVNIDHKRVASGGVICEVDFNQTKTINHTCNTSVGGCNELPNWSGSCTSPLVNLGGVCQRTIAFQANCDTYLDWSCTCEGGCYGGSCSPIVVDVLGNGFSLTNANNGVNFNLNNIGASERIGWTSTGSDDAWLAYDSDNNGVIDQGSELFGDVSPQDPPGAGEQRNGFRALAHYDRPMMGGNNDGKINHNDAIFDRLKLWQDANHDGVSETYELFSLPQLGLRRIDLDYVASQRVDAHGNQFKYRSRVYDNQNNQLGRWAWDVFLVVQQP